MGSNPAMLGRGLGSLHIIPNPFTLVGVRRMGQTNDVLVQSMELPKPVSISEAVGSLAGIGLLIFGLFTNRNIVAGVGASIMASAGFSILNRKLG